MNLRELGEVNRGRSRHRPRYAEHLYGGPYPFIQTGDVKASNGRVTSYAQTYSEAGLAQSRLWPAGTMCITIAANIAETGILTFPACFPDSVVGFIAEPKKADVQFVEYMFRFMRSRIQHQATGSVQDNINIETLDRLRFPIPPLAEQKAIAAVLGALDDKIELNRRMNATLEAIARALFQSWFVDFDPVRAKLDCRKPEGMDAATAALFPGHLVESPLGHIPRGWEVRTIESVCKAVTRGVTPEYGAGTGRFIINQRVNRGFDLDWSSLKELSQGLEVPPERFAKRWDVLVNCLGEGTLGRTHLYKGVSDVYAVDQHMSICRAEYPSGGAYIYQVLSGADGQAKIESLKTGSTGMTMFNISKLRTFEMVWPSSAVLAAYFKSVESLWLQIANNDHQSRTLATLRDMLLPKLLSGELSVADVSKTPPS